MARIIIADDDELVGEIACHALFDSGHVAGAVTDGREALRIVRERRPDLLVLDCNMPGMNGLLVLDELRKLSEFCDLPVLVLTGRTSDKDEALAHFYGANDYMRKPFDPVELAFRVDELLAKFKRAAPVPRRARTAGFGRRVAR